MKRPKLTLRANGGGLSVVEIAVITFLVILMIVALQMIRALVEERNQRRLEAEGGIIGSWGGEQTVGGPFIVVPYTVRRKNDEGKIESFVERAYFLPEFLEIRGEVQPEQRSRGIYEVTLYSGRLEVFGRFAALDLSEWRIASPDILHKTDVGGAAEEIVDGAAGGAGPEVVEVGDDDELAAGAGDADVEEVAGGGAGRRAGRPRGRTRRRSSAFGKQPILGSSTSTSPPSGGAR